MKNRKEVYAFDLFISGYASRRNVIWHWGLYIFLGLVTVTMFVLPLFVYPGVPIYYWPPLFFYLIGVMLAIFETPFAIKNIKKNLYDSDEKMGYLDDTALTLFPGKIQKGFTLSQGDIKQAKVLQTPFEKFHHYGTLVITDQNGHEHFIHYLMNPEDYLSLLSKD
jgi:hypothetical protein